MAFNYQNTTIDAIKNVKFIDESGKEYTVKKVYCETADTKTLVYEKSSILVAGTSTGLWYSEDDGETWSPSNVTSGVWWYVFYFANTFYACSPNYRYISVSNDGKTWSNSSNFTNPFYYVLCTGSEIVNFYTTSLRFYDYYLLQVETRTASSVCQGYENDYHYYMRDNNIYEVDRDFEYKVGTLNFTKGQNLADKFLLAVIGNYIFVETREDKGGSEAYDYYTEIHRFNLDGTGDTLLFSDNPWGDNWEYIIWYNSGYIFYTRYIGSTQETYYCSYGDDSFKKFPIYISTASFSAGKHSLNSPITKIDDKWYINTTRYTYTADTLTGTRTQVVNNGGSTRYQRGVFKAGNNILCYGSYGVYIKKDGESTFTRSTTEQKDTYIIVSASS